MIKNSLVVIEFGKDFLHCIRKVKKFKKKRLIFFELSYTYKNLFQEIIKMNKNLTKILERLSLSDAENTTKDILRIYEKKGICVVHFLYFANIILNKLDTENTPSSQKEAFIQALFSGDFLLPDGIALSLLYKKHFQKELSNLNGTDFLPYFFFNIPKIEKVEILLYGASNEVVAQVKPYIIETF